MYAAIPSNSNLDFRGLAIPQQHEIHSPQHPSIDGQGPKKSCCGNCAQQKPCCGKKKQGMGALGLFDSLDPTTWGPLEWGATALAGYLVFTLIGDTRRVASRVSGAFRARRSKRRRRQQLREELSSL